MLCDVTVLLLLLLLLLAGCPDPLVFHAPQMFFDCLQARISLGKKKRLPNHTTSFYRRDALPLGLFTKYTWYITNILHVKQIFDTAPVSLDVMTSWWLHVYRCLVYGELDIFTVKCITPAAVSESP